MGFLMRKTGVVFLSFFLLFIIDLTAPAETPRIALVIGNAAYDGDARLKNPVNDATDVAASLERVGWQVTLVVDADRRTMNRSIVTFRDELAASEGASALFYYAGHGMQVDGENYLIPVKSDFETVDDVKADSVSVQSLSEAVERAKAGVSLVILDACRDNPFAKKMTRSLGGSRGLTVVQNAGGAKGSAIMFSTSPGDVAMDGTGRNGVFTAALLKHLESNLKIEELFKRVTGEVREVSGGAQKPWINASLSSDFYFVSDAIRAERTAEAARIAAEARRVELEKAAEAARAEEAAKAEKARAEAAAARATAAEALADRARLEQEARLSAEKAAAAEAAAKEAVRQAELARLKAETRMESSGAGIDPNTPVAVWLRKAAGQSEAVVASFFKENADGTVRVFNDADQFPANLEPGSYTVRARLAEDIDFTYEGAYQAMPGGSLVVELPKLTWSPAFLRRSELKELSIKRRELEKSLRESVQAKKVAKTIGWIDFSLGAVSLAATGYLLVDGLLSMAAYRSTDSAAEAIDLRRKIQFESIGLCVAAPVAGGTLLLSWPLLADSKSIKKRNTELQTINARIEALGGRK